MRSPLSVLAVPFEPWNGRQWIRALTSIIALTLS
jgi:hypothetical protein